jgi:hypothetical protein
MRTAHILMQNDSPVSAHLSPSSALAARRAFAVKKGLVQVEGTLFFYELQNGPHCYLHFRQVPLEDD